jgi:palmitoyltransferase
VVLAVAAYTLSTQLTGGLVIDGFIIATIAMSGFFGLFTFMMTATSFRFIFINLTNVDVIRHKSKVYQLAIRVPRGTEPTSRYGVITYPLPKPRLPQNGHVEDSNGESSRTTANKPASRDQLAQRTFAIVKTEMGENVWDLGYYQNWVSVMGTNIVDWLLPIRDSPCCHEENNVSAYRLGPVYERLKRRYNLPELPSDDAGIEMAEMRRRA